MEMAWVVLHTERPGWQIRAKQLATPTHTATGVLVLLLFAGKAATFPVLPASACSREAHTRRQSHLMAKGGHTSAGWQSYNCNHTMCPLALSPGLGGLRVTQSTSSSRRCSSPVSTPPASTCTVKVQHTFHISCVMLLLEPGNRDY